ncbi:hypothetical protein [Natronosalvus hydrolyticus]|uniref:hypothetical protein n=1 Tax=Natronosalvus hydrolyticus TaxID=2979988 RepID=UPI003CCC6D8D
MGVSEPFGQRGRLLAGVLLFTLLIGMLLVAGTTANDPLEHQYPTDVEVTPTPEMYVGEQVILGGRIVDTDPVTIATRASGYGRFTLVDANTEVRNLEGSLQTGDHVTVFGTLEDENTLVVEYGLTQSPDDRSYMFLVSFLGGLWVAGRFLTGWRFDRKTLAFVPRADTKAQGDDSPDTNSRSLSFDETDLKGTHESKSTTEPDRHTKRGDR